MTTQSAIRNQDTLLQRTLMANTAFSLVSGLILLLASQWVATFLGVTNAAGLIAGTGLAILAFALFVGYTATRPMIERQAATSIFVLDVLWVAASAIVLITNAFSLTTEGRWAILIIADLVGVLAVLEFIGLRRMRQRY